MTDFEKKVDCQIFDKKFPLFTKISTFDQLDMVKLLTNFENRLKSFIKLVYL